MFESLVLIAVFTLLTAYLFAPSNGLDLTLVKLKSGLKSFKPAGSLPVALNKTVVSSIGGSNDFLLQLQRDIESQLSPRPTDSILRRHYDSHVAAELQSRLEKMPRS